MRRTPPSEIDPSAVHRLGQRNPKRLEEGLVKKNLTAAMTAITLLTALAIPVHLAAQDKQDRKSNHHHYQLVDIGTFGGPNSSVATGFFDSAGSQSISNQG